ncbi:MAG: hypothetical protein H6673_06895 [Anaerolineales bacterium]|nr:hypothetical protein [Anaerolineales bacterium]
MREAKNGLWVGGVTSGVAVGVAGTLNGSDPVLAVVIGAVLGVVIGVIIGTVAMFRPVQKAYPYAVLGAVIGLVAFTFAPVLGIKLNDIVSSSWIGAVSGLFFGSIIGYLTGRVVMPAVASVVDTSKG